MPPALTDPYSALGLRQGASRAEIVSSFRQLALRHHPDHNPGDEGAAARFRHVSAAYQRLKENNFHLPRVQAGEPSSARSSASSADEAPKRSGSRRATSPLNREDRWPDGAPIHYPSQQEMDAILYQRLEGSVNRDVRNGALLIVGAFLVYALLEVIRGDQFR